MDNWRIYLIIAAGLSAFLGILLKHALNKADEQRRAAIILRAYLLYWTRWAIDSNVYPIFDYGKKWYSEYQEALRRSGTPEQRSADLVRIDKEYQESLATDLKEELQATDGSKKSEVAVEIDKGIEHARKVMQHLSPDMLANHAFELRRELVNGTAFVTDQEVSSLSPKVVVDVVELRALMADLFASLALSIHQIRADSDEAVRTDSLLQQVVSAAVSGVKIGFLKEEKTT